MTSVPTLFYIGLGYIHLVSLLIYSFLLLFYQWLMITENIYWRIAKLLLIIIITSETVGSRITDPDLSPKSKISSQKKTFKEIDFILGVHGTISGIRLTLSALNFFNPFSCYGRFDGVSGRPKCSNNNSNSAI